MATTFYGFDVNTRMGAFTASGQVREDPSYIVIESEEMYDISSIRLSEDGVIEIVTPTEQQMQLSYEAERSRLLYEAAAKIDLLRDLVEFTPSVEHDNALTEWRNYRAELYTATLNSLDDLPAAPKQ